MMQKKPTIKDVAQQAGVSTATVSFVLNNRPGQVISERVKQRVWRVARELEYHPSASAAGLARQRTHNVAIVFYHTEQLVSNQFYSFVIQGAIKEAMRREFNLMFSYVDRDYRGYADLPKVIRERNAEGVMIIQHLSTKMVADIEARGVPVVAVDNHPRARGINTLQIDNRRGGELAANHLIDQGHRQLALILGADDRPSITERAEAFIATAEQRGIQMPARTSIVRADNLTFAGGYDAASKLFARKRRPTAVFCANDEMAAGMLRAAREHGVSVPRDLAVIGFDGITMSNYTDPPLTTISVDKESLGIRAMARLLDLVQGSDPDPVREVVGVELVVRASTAPASAAPARKAPHAASAASPRLAGRA